MSLEQKRSTIERISPTAPHIPATTCVGGLVTRSSTTTAFLVLYSHSDIGAVSGGSNGFFHSDTRFVSHFELRFNDTSPLLLGSNVRDDDLTSSADLNNHERCFAKSLDPIEERFATAKTQCGINIHPRNCDRICASKK